MKKIFLTIVLWQVLLNLHSQNITFNSPELEACVKSHLQLDSSQQVTAGMADTITMLECFGNNVEDIGDLLYFPNLKRLNLSGNRISDVTPIASLSHLQFVNLSSNRLQYIYPLALSDAFELTLDIGNNHITDFSDLYNSSLSIFKIIGQDLQDPVMNAPQVHLNYLDASVDSMGTVQTEYCAWISNGATATLSFGDGQSEQVVADGYTHTIAHDYTYNYYNPEIDEYEFSIDFVLKLFYMHDTLDLNFNRPSYVNINATGNNDGSSWLNAYTNLQFAGGSVAGIWVAKGTYLPINPEGESKFSFYANRKVYGGFSGNETRLDQRDWVNNATILSGDIGIPNDSSDNSRQVVYIYTESEGPPIMMKNKILPEKINKNNEPAYDFIMDGFTIQDAYCDTNNIGAIGIYNNSGNFNVCIKNCIVKNNYTKSSSMYPNNIGLYCSKTSHLTIDNCTFNNNFAGSPDALFTITLDSTDASIINCRFFNNTGGIKAIGNSVSLTNSIFYSNNIFYPLISLNAINASISNCDFLNNSVYSENLIYTGQTLTNIKNCIFNLADPFAPANLASNVGNCIIPGGYAGGTNIIDNLPLFANAAGADNIDGTLDDDFRLLPCSPGIDAGDTSGIIVPLTDFLGNNRFVNGSIDIGAYECQSNTTAGGTFLLSYSDSIICNGDSVYLSGSINGYLDIQYQWYFNGTAIPGAVTSQFYAKNQGYYFLKIDVGICHLMAQDSIFVKVISTPATPVIAYSGSANLCQGASIVLNAPNGYTYLWSNSATTQSISVNTPGSYTVSVFNNDGCSSSASNPVIVTVNPIPDAPSVVTPVKYCIGEQASLLSASGTNLLWYNTNSGGSGSTTVPVPATTTEGSFSFFVSQSTQFCESNRTQISVQINPLPPTPTITQNDVNLTSSSLSGNQWYGPSGIINGATNQTFQPLQTGTYSVIVTDGNNCSSQSQSYNFVSGIEELTDQNKFSIFPNPVKKELTITVAHDIPRHIKIELLDDMGRVVFTSTIDKNSTIDISNFSRGVYLVKLYTEKSIFVKSFVKE